MFAKKLLSWLLPYTCILCNQASGREQDLCEACLHDLPLITTDTCKLCATSLKGRPNRLICGQCLTHTPPFDVAFALSDYQKPMDTLLLELKFKQALLNARVLGELMSEKIQTLWYKTTSLPDMIIPIPLHPKRLKERGYNQAAELARPIARACRLPIELYACERIKCTTPQATLPANERVDNIKHAFKTHTRFDGIHIAVIDDVMTTGHTMREFCHLLKKYGAKRIDVWCCARPQVSSTLSR